MPAVEMSAALLGKEARAGLIAEPSPEELMVGKPVMPLLAPRWVWPAGGKRLSEI
jgi:hypothetical protein